MGLEKTCEARHGGKAATVTAHLEPAELRLRGGLEFTISTGAMKSAVFPARLPCFSTI